MKLLPFTACQHFKLFLPLLPALMLLSATASLNAQINLVNIGHTNNGGTAQGIAVSGNYAYLASGTNGLLIYDISNPALPVNVGHTHASNDTQINAYAVAVSGNYAFVETSGGNPTGLFVYDVSNAAAPTNVNFLNMTVFGGLAILGSDLYLGGDDRVPVLAISNPLDLNTGTYYMPLDNINPVSLAATSNYLAMAGGGDGLVNIGAFSNGVYANLAFTNVGPNGIANGVAIAGQYVFVASGNSISAPLISYYISSSGKLTKVGQITYPAPSTTGFSVTLCGNYAYLVCSAGLRVINIANPTNLIAAGQTSTNFGAKPTGVAVSGHYAYLADGTDGLRVFAIQPALGMRLVAGTGLNFSWPAQGSFVVQQTADLSNPDWVTVTNVPTDGQVTLPPPANTTYYRLLGQ
jgi:hypothetical protein